MAIQLQSTNVRGLRLALGLSQESLARVLDVSARSVERWERGSQSRDVEVRRRLDELDEIAMLGREAYGEGLARFMSTPRRGLGQRTPAETLARGDRHEVLGLLAKIVEGQWA